MTALVETLNAWGAVWASLVLRSLVEASLVLAVVLAIWLPLRRRMSAQLAYGLFLLVLLKLALPIPVPWNTITSASIRSAAVRASKWSRPAPPVETVPEVLPSEDPVVIAVPEPEPIVAATAVPVEAIRPAEPGGDPSPRPDLAQTPAPGIQLPALFMIGWAAVCSLLIGRFARSVLALRRLLREAIPLEDASECLAIDLEALRKASGVKGCIRWAVSPRITSPAVGGLIRPTVVIPPDLEDDLTPKQMSWVLLHELAHVRRGDLWVLTFQRLVGAVFFFHPAALLANWILDELREFACDDMALAASHVPRHDCGEGFLTVVGRTVDSAIPSAAAALGLFESRMLIRRRLLRILDNRRTIHDRLSGRALAGLLILALIVLPYGRPRKAVAESQTPAPIGLTTEDEPRLFSAGSTFLHDDRVASAGFARMPVLAVAYSPDGRLLATAGEDHSIIIRDARTGTLQVRIPGEDTITSLAFLPDGNHVVSGGYDRSIRIWSSLDGRPVRTLEGHSNWVFAVAVSQDGKTIASAGSDRTIRLWDSATGTPLSILTGHTSAVRSVAFGPDGSTVASAGADRAVILWDWRKSCEKIRFQGHSGTIRAVRFAPDGRTLASAGEDGEVRLWDLRTGRERVALTGHQDMVLSLAFSPGGETLASGSLDASIKLWDVRTGRERTTLTGHGEGVASLSFAPGHANLHPQVMMGQSGSGSRPRRSSRPPRS